MAVVRVTPFPGRMLICSLAVLLGACSGDDGNPGPPGPPGPPAGVDIANAQALEATIGSVSIGSPPVVTFTLHDGNGNPVKHLPASAVSFNIAKLVPGTNGNPSAWQSYLNDVEQPGVGPGTEPAVRAVTENGAAGTLTDNDDGSYTYTFATDVTDVTEPLPVAYDPALTHRVSLEIRGYAPVRNPIYDFRPGDEATSGLFTREIAGTAACNVCHADLALHGGARFEVRECVLCHNPGSTDANSGNTLDMTVMTHRIHRGSNLPSVMAGGDYCIYGRGGVPHCYGTVVYPQDIRACANCHDSDDADTPDALNWYTVPTAAACGSCHDDVDFETGENHADIPVADNTLCASCHTDESSRIEVRQAHRMREREAAGAYRYSVLGVTSPGPGGAPVATFSVTDPTDGDRPYDLAATPALANGGLRLSLAWPTVDYSNLGGGPANAQPPAVAVFDTGALQAVSNGDGTYDLTLATVPADQTGSGVVVLEGAVTDPELGALGVTNAHRYFAITDDPSAPVPRRTSVAMSRCNDCHDSLSFHGGRNTDSIESCQTCHNADAARGGTPSRGPMDMKHFLHRNHAVDDVDYPQPASNCLACHVDGGYYPVSSASGVRPTSADRGTDPADPFDNDRITANAAACGVCHDTPDARAHIGQNGGSFAACLAADGTVFRKVDVCGSQATLGEVIEESCRVCHGPGRSADVAEVHGL
ncbi:MAG: OmcA/MtrC family decaheme c-type cytochrome [Pseudomonadales bacterium]|jgi:OmcA/MtrC family decaheme c-type cytochrome